MDDKRDAICEVDMDNADYIGDGTDGCYCDAARAEDGWYFSTVVDSETGSFCGFGLTDQGPFETEEAALEAGRGAAEDWCADNGVISYDDAGLSRFSAAMKAGDWETVASFISPCARTPCPEPALLAWLAGRDTYDGDDPWGVALEWDDRDTPCPEPNPGGHGRPLT